MKLGKLQCDPYVPITGGEVPVVDIVVELWDVVLSDMRNLL